jgi:hypothetical protein
VLLGDIVELWDAENQAVILSGAAISEPLRSVPGSKVHVIGNHDNVMGALAGSYPFGSPPLEVVGEVFPPPDHKDIVTPMRIGSRSYVFVHGHQFDPQFMLVQRAWALLGLLRQFGAAMGDWSWIFGGLALIALVMQLLAPSPMGWVVFGALLAAWVPRFYMTYARRFWRKIAGTRYNRKATLGGFERWWRKFGPDVVASDDLAIVYGHTHYLDWVEAGQAEAGVEAAGISGPEASLLRLLAGERPRTSLFNVSAWVSTDGKHKDVVMATMFYADAEGPVVLGWDWSANRPFHIPFSFLRSRRLDQPLDATQAKIAEELLWPPELIEKWSTTSEKVRTGAKKNPGPPKNGPKPS